ncbi:MAG: hypothetical protein HY327_07075 [Chloroflexi bacterium]|nr:hypothetical protein [Chloroflexota bacterium]
MREKKSILLLLALGNLFLFALIISVPPENLSTSDESPEEEIEQDPFNGDSAARSSNAAHSLARATESTDAAPTRAIVPLIPQPPARSVPAPTDDPPKAPYIFPTPIFIPDSYSDSPAPIRPRPTPTPTRRR